MCKKVEENTENGMAGVVFLVSMNTSITAFMPHKGDHHLNAYNVSITTMRRSSSSLLLRARIAQPTDR